MRYFRKYLFLYGVLLLSTPLSYAQQMRVYSIDYNFIEGASQLVLGVSDMPIYQILVMDKPSRLVVDVKSVKLTSKLNQPSPSHPLFSQLRTAVKNENDLRIVVDLKQPVIAKASKVTRKNSEMKALVIDVQGKNSIVSAHPLTKKTDLKRTKIKLVETAEKPNEKITQTAIHHKTNGKKRFIVAIDAGHGGNDPGAKGPKGTLEKQVTLAIAAKLQGLINGQPGMKARLVRKGDYKVGLRERMNIARKANADLFISIHADAVNNPEVRGASVYTLSRNGASSEAARWLADSENAKDRVGGVNLEDKDEVLASVILDLSQTATQQASVTIANKILKNFQRIGDLHYNDVQQAGFAVLKSPDIPSILVETAYISNPSDELNLVSTRYQTKIATAILKGIINYYDQIDSVESDKMAKLE